jgi:hypothetical protein
LFADLQGHNIRNKSSPIRACSRHISHFHVHSFNARFFTKQPTRMPSCGLNYWTSQFSFVSGNIFEGKSLLTSRLCGSRGMYMSRQRLGRWERSRLCAAVDVGSAIDVINDLGLDTLTFLGVTVVVVPVFKTIRASPVRFNISYSSNYFLFHLMYHSTIIASKCFGCI